MLPELGKLMIIQTGAAQAFVIKAKTERMNQVQNGARIGTNAYDIARIRRYFRLKKNHFKHGSSR